MRWHLLLQLLVVVAIIAAQAVASEPLRYSGADVVRVCGDGESLLHSMQYAMIKQQRALKDDPNGAAQMQKVR